MRELNINELAEVNGGNGECKYAGEEYSDGAKLEQEGVVMTCSDGQWVES